MLAPPSRKLLCFDLNGVLCMRTSKRKDPQGAGSTENKVDFPRQTVWRRFGAAELVQDLQAAGIDVAVWSSAMPANVHEVLRCILPRAAILKLRFIWTSVECEVRGDRYGSNKPAFKKDAHKIVAAFPEYKGRVWIVDDELDKCVPGREQHFVVVPKWGGTIDESIVEVARLAYQAVGLPQE